MSLPYPATLQTTERVLKALSLLNLLYGAGLALLLIASVVAPDLVIAGLAGPRARGEPGLAQAMRTLMVAGLAAVPVAQFLLTRLRAVLQTVRDGAPFALANAIRLKHIAYALLALELLHLAVGVMLNSSVFDAFGLHIDWCFSFTPWVAILLLRVLARVFEHGARLRADLDGVI